MNYLYTQFFYKDFHKEVTQITEKAKEQSSVYEKVSHFKILVYLKTSLALDI